MMRDVMFFGVLEMPLELAFEDRNSTIQFWNRAQSAVARIKSDADTIATLTAERDKLRAALIGIRRASKARMTQKANDDHGYYFYTADAAIGETP